jgi:zinc-ribbon domain
MMYSNKFVATLKNNGKVLREQGDTVYLPFGSEYSILLKNLNTVRAQVKIDIDGQDVLNGAALIVNPNSDLEIERFLTNNERGNRFKFIERTASIEEHRGVGATDGLVRIEFQFEKLYPPVYTPRPDPWGNSLYYSTNAPIVRSMSCTNINVSGSVTCGETMDSYVPQNNDAGITVPGSISEQKFRTVSSFPLEQQRYAIVLQLKGETDYSRVVEPVTVKSKPKCTTCGKVNKATSKFCSNCGTSLEII